MKDFVLKLSTYDYFAIWLPGWLLINEIAYLLCGDSVISWGTEILFAIAAYAIGLILHMTAEQAWEKNGYRNNHNDILDSYQKYYVCKKETPSISVENISKDVIKNYFIAYDLVAKNDECKNVMRTLERQIAFGRSIIIPLCVSALDVIVYYFNSYIFVERIECLEKAIIMGIITLLICVFIFVLTCKMSKALPQKQRNLYRYVFENVDFVEHGEQRNS